MKFSYLFSTNLLTLILTVGFSLSISANVVIKGEIRYSDILIISYWDNYHYISDTIKSTKTRLFEKRYNFKKPTSIWINNNSCAFIMPNDTLHIVVKEKEIVLKRNAGKYITFRRNLAEGIGAIPKKNINSRTQFAILKSDEFFSKYEHSDIETMKRLNYAQLVINYKLYPLLIANSHNKQKIDSISTFFKCRVLDKSNDYSGALFTYLDKIEIHDDVITQNEFLEVLNNIIRIKRDHFIESIKLKEEPNFIIEKNIIYDLFGDSRVYLPLMIYNISFNIDSSKNIQELLLIGDYLELFKANYPNEYIALINRFKGKKSKLL
jgi:hypothetical protein